MYRSFIQQTNRVRKVPSALVVGAASLLVLAFAATADAQVTVEPLPVPDTKVPQGASLETVAAFELTTTQTINLVDITVRATGTGNAVLGVAAVYLAIDTNDDGYFRTGDDTILGYDIFTDFSGEKRAHLGAGSKLIQPGERHRFFVVIDLQPWAYLDATFGVEVTDLRVSQNFTVSGLPITGAELYVTNTAYMRLKGPLPTGKKALPKGAYDVALTEMQGRAYGHAMALRSLTFVHDGDGEAAEGISQIEVWLDTNVSWAFERNQDTLLGSGTFASGQDSLTITLHDPWVNGPPWFLVNEPRWIFVRVHLRSNAPGGETYPLRVAEANVEFAPASGLPIVASPLFVDAPPPPEPPPPGNGDNGNGDDNGDNGDDDNDNGDGNGDKRKDRPGGTSSRSATLFFCGASGSAPLLIAAALLIVLIALRRRLLLRNHGAAR